MTELCDYMSCVHFHWLHHCRWPEDFYNCSADWQEGWRGKKRAGRKKTTEPLEAQLDCEVSGTAPVRNGTILVDKCCTGRAINVEIFIAGFVADKLHHSSLPQYTQGHGHQKVRSALKQRFASLFYCTDGEKPCLPSNTLVLFCIPDLYYVT